MSESRGTVRQQIRGWSGFIVISLLLHVPLFIYPVLRIAHWLDLPDWLTLVVLLPLAGSQIVSRVLLRHRRSLWARWLRRLADFWLGISPIVLILVLSAEIIVFPGWLSPATAARVVIIASLLLGVAGIVTAMSPMVRTIRFASSGLDSPVRFVQITDVHIGSRSRAFLEKIVGIINDLEPDFVCITGDFIDEAGIEESELESLKTIQGPVYFCIGNHEKYEDLDDILTRLRNLGVHVLRNGSRSFREDLQVIGIDDMDDALQVGRQLQHIEVRKDRFVLLLYHRPRGLEAAAKAGIDLMLSGHTHNGQIVPFNLVVSRVFDRVEGMHCLGKTRLYVSQGTGTWGPVMRIGTRSEITLFEIEPEGNKDVVG